MNQALYRKWRPRKWQDVFGQSHITQTLQNAIQSGRLVHAYLFAGPRGTGKTSMARLLAKAVNCLDPDPANRPCNHCEICNAINEGRFLDLIEIDAASNTSVDDVRDLRDKIKFSPSMGKYKVYIIDEVHMLSMSAFNALLKTLEEPPEHAIFVLATTEIHKIPATVLSRCQRHEFRRISVQDIVQQLEMIAAGENMQIDPAALTLVARQSTGAMRDAISLLDQLASSGEKVTVEYASNILGTATNQSVIQLVEDILQQNTVAGLEHLHTALDTGIDPRQYARQIVDYLRNILLFKMGSPLGEDLTADTRTQVEKHARLFEKKHLLFCIQRYNALAVDVRGNWQPGLGLELAFAETCKTGDEADEAPYQSPSQPSSYQPSIQSHPVAPRQDAPESRPLREQPQEPPAHPGEPSKAKTETRPAAVQPRQTVQAEEPVRQTGASLDEKSVFRKLRDGWDEIRRQTRKVSPQVEGLVNSCKVAGVVEHTIQLGCNSEFVKSKLETKENLAIIEPIISRFLGEQVEVVCVVIKNNPAGSKNTPTEDGMVNAALGLGGQIIQQD